MMQRRSQERLAHLLSRPAQPALESQLKECPPLSHALKIGFLGKRGHINQGWRRRWCAAANRQDGFVVSYYDEPSSPKPNGSIDCSFCNVIPFSEKESEEAQFGFKVGHFLYSNLGYF